jgi:hypothetical protein
MLLLIVLRIYFLSIIIVVVSDGVGPPPPTQNTIGIHIVGSFILDSHYMNDISAN